MAKFESTNPMLNVDRIRRYDSAVATKSETAMMTLAGTAQKSLILIALCIVSAGLMFSHIYNGVVDGSINTLSYGLAMGALIGALIFYFVGLFFVKTAFICAPLYAILEGVVLGNLSAIFEIQYPGIVFQATLATFSVTAVMFVGFSTGLFKVTAKFRSMIFAAGVAVFLTYIVDLLLSLFSGSGLSFLSVQNTSLLSIGISVIICIVAALFLLLDFDNIANLHGQVSKHYEWVCGMGLLATIVWLYVEILKLLAKLNNRN
jgi:uncharacterized YccA/Bax inhibitor family protein